MRTIGQMVRCTQCGEEKPWERGIFKSERDRLRQPCVACDTKRRARNADQNRDRERASGRERMASWRARNPEKVRAANRAPRKFNRAAANERIRRWKRAHPDSSVVSFHQRKSKMRKLPSSFRRVDWRRCLDYWGHRCCICGRLAGDGYVLAQEHWIAIADPRPDNPGHVPWNLVPMCHARGGAVGGCNNAKWTRDPVAWLTATLGPEVAAERVAAVEEYFASVWPEVQA